MTNFLQDVRFAIRLLVKDRSFALTAILTLTICIAANTAVFSIVRSVLLKPLPFAGSSRVVYLYNSYPNAGAPRVGAGVPDYFDRLEAVPALDMQALFQNNGFTYGDESSSEQITGLTATPSFFRLVQAQPVLGRLFTDAEGEPGQDRKVLLHFGFWQRKFGGDGSVLGRQVRLNGNMYEVVGVLPREFSFMQNDLDVFLPAAFTPDAKSDARRHSNNHQMIGRLRDGATLEQVRQQVDALNARNNERFPHFKQILQDARFRTVALMLQDDIVRDVKGALYILWAGVGFVLLIGCVNIANLIIVRSSGRTRELATRHALGGDLRRLSRQLVTETTVLAGVGCALGIAAGWWTLRSITALHLSDLPRGYEIRLDAFTVVLMIGITGLVGIVLGLAPALRLRRMNLNVDLRESRGGTANRTANRLRRTLAVVQIAVALVLLVGAGLLFASFRAVLRLDLGFDPQNVYTAALVLPSGNYPNPAALVGIEQRLLQAVRAMPEVEAAGTASSVPFSGQVNNSVILAEGYVTPPGESLVATTNLSINPGYLEAMHAQVLRGRLIDARDTQNTPRSVVIDDRLARKFWPDRDPVGHRLYFPTSNEDLTRITKDTQFFNVVGVIKEMRILDPRPDVNPVGTVFFAWEQNPGRGPTLVVKTKRPVPGLMASIRREFAAIDRQVPLFRERTMQEWIDRQLVGRKLPMLVAAAFAVVALFLAALGIYGVLAHSVNERRRELGVRLALGGTTGRIFALVLGDGAKIVIVGLVVGLAGAYGVSRLIQNQLFDVAPMNPVIFSAVAVGLAVVALVACFLPAWRASRIDPVVVLSR